MLSRPDVFGKLSRSFVGVRFDWEQGNHYKDKIGFVLGTGDQMLLTPGGEKISHDDVASAQAKKAKDAKNKHLFGRHGCDTTGEVLDAVLAKHKPTDGGEPPLKIEWFLWPQKRTRGGKGIYPVPHHSAAQYARLPLAFIEGEEVPPALQDPALLRRHVRQFIWVRGKSAPGAAGRIIVRRVKDGLADGLSTDIASIDPRALSQRELGQALDAAWLTYMKDRPLVAKGYLDNPHGRWMRGQAEQMTTEERQIREKARAGTLLPPGRKAEDKPL